MTFLQGLEKFNHIVSKFMEWIGIIAYLLIMAVTCIDVLGAKLINIPLFGALDIVMLAQLITVTFTASITYMVGRHVQVEFFTLLFPKRTQAIFDCIIQSIGFVLFILIVWRLILFGHYLQIGGEESATAHIPLFPFVYGAAAACVPLCLVFLQELIRSFVKVLKK